MAGMTGQRYNNGAVLPVKPPYGVCSSEADTQVKAVVVPSISALEAGLFILVKFSNAQTYDGVPKLNVNGLGAKDIKTNGTTGAARYEWNAGEVLSFYYDGTYWLIVRDGTASTTYYGKTKLTNAVDSDSEILAASAKAVKTVADQLAGKLSASDKGAAGGVAELDATGKVPASQLPSYVDDVLEYASLSNFPATGENGKIYIATDTNKQYRWSGTQYVEIASSLALGETSATAYRGDRGKAAYDHATDAYKVSSAKTEALYKVSVTSEGHVGSVTPVQKSDITALGIPGSDTDTKNTAGTVNKAGEKMFLVGATTQGANPETNSNSKVYIGTDNELYSNEKKVAHAEDIKQMTGASASAAGTAGYVPAPGIGDQNKFLKGDGTWGEVQTSEIDDTAGTGDTNKTWSADKIAEELENVSVPVMTGASASAAGTSGTVPAPGIGDQDKFFKGDGTWGTVSGANVSAAFTDVNFSIAVADWTAITGGFKAVVQDTAFTATSKIWYFLNADYYENAPAPMNFEVVAGGVEITTEEKPIGTVSGVLRTVEAIPVTDATEQVLAGTLRVVPFSISKNDWALDNGAYKYNKVTEHITLSSVEFVEYDSSFRDAIRGDIEVVKTTGGGGMTFITNVQPVGTLTGEIRVFDRNDGKIAIITEQTALPTMRDVPFTVEVSDWAINASGKYEAVFETAYITATSHDFVEFDESIENATDGIKVVKAEYDGEVIGLKFVSRRVPAGDISGTVTPLDNADGKVAVALQDTVMPIANGGTGANTLAGAQENLGITYLQQNVEALKGVWIHGRPSSYGSGVKSMDYPNGFTWNNCYVAAAYYDYSPTGNKQHYPMPNPHVGITLAENGILIAADGASWIDGDYYIMLVKL